MNPRGLINLRELDLDGKPCARSEGYKHRAIHSCKRLQALDGEDILQLDRDLSELFFEEQQQNLWRVSMAGGMRPTTAPANWNQWTRPGSGFMDRDHSVGRKAFGGFRGLPSRQTRVLPSDRLNNNPLVSFAAGDEMSSNYAPKPRAHTNFKPSLGPTFVIFRTLVPAVDFHTLLKAPELPCTRSPRKPVRFTLGCNHNVTV